MLRAMSEYTKLQQIQRDLSVNEMWDLPLVCTERHVWKRILCLKVDEGTTKLIEEVPMGSTENEEGMVQLVARMAGFVE